MLSSSWGLGSVFCGSWGLSESSHESLNGAAGAGILVRTVGTHVETLTQFSPRFGIGEEARVRSEQREREKIYR